MNKVVYNDCYGVFSLSEQAIKWLRKNYPDYLEGSCSRHDPRLVECVETLQGKASGKYARLRVATIEGNIYRIDNYDGQEHVVEPQDLNWITIE